MALSRNRMATTRRIQSRRRVWLCLSNNEPELSKEIRGKEILLESEDSTHNKDSKTAKEA